MSDVDEKMREEAEALLADIKAIQKSLTDIPKPNPDDTLLSIVHKIPFYSSILRRINATNSAIHKLIRVNGYIAPLDLDGNNITPVVGAILNILDFVQIPIVYTVAFALGGVKKIPFTLSNNAKWLYAAVLLSLFLTAWFVPALAPIIAITTASIGLAVSIFGLGRLAYHYYQDKKALDANPVMQLKKLDKELDDALKKNDVSRTNDLINEIKSLKNECITHPEEMKGLYQQKLELEEKLKIESRLMNRSIAIALGSLALIGTVLTLFLPPVGAAILIGVALAGSTYGLTMFFAPLLVKLVNWLREEPKKNEDLVLSIDPVIDNALHAAVKNNIDPHPTVTLPEDDETAIHESTTTISDQLSDHHKIKPHPRAQDEDLDEDDDLDEHTKKDQGLHQSEAGSQQITDPDIHPSKDASGLEHESPHT